MSNPERTIESLLASRALAEKATKGDWYMVRLPHPSDHFNVRASFSAANVEQICRCNAPTDANKANAAHIATNSPDVVMADIDEILRLRAQVERLEKEADWLISTKIVEEWNGRFVGAQNKDNSGYAVYPTKAEAVASWREAARKAIGCK